jgi:hypothetical protein
MADIFGRNQYSVGGVFTAESAIVTASAGGSSWEGALVQNFSANYSQAYNPLYEIGSNKVYRVLGRPQGQITIGSIVALNSSGGVDLSLFNACSSGGEMTVSMAPGLCNNGGTGLSMSFSGVFVVSYGVTLNANDMLIQQNVQLAFTSMSKR